MTSGERPDWDALFARRTLGIRLGLEVVRGVFDALGRPAGRVPAVHIVGTNGKGSTAAMVAHGLGVARARAAGGPAGVGLYTSPHLHRVGERVVVDGQPVDDAALWDAVRRVDVAEDEARPTRPLSFFEVLTLAAMVAFERAAVRSLVVEAGLGGRLDATRVVRADVVAVTSIARDHEQWLGEGLASIATEKAGVFAANVPVISAPQAPAVQAVLREAAHRVGCPLTFVSPLSRAPVGLRGPHQRINAAVALAVLRLRLGDADAKALDGVRWPGRLESLPVGRGRVTLDAAHNEAACLAVADALRDDAPQTIVVGCQPDKDRSAMARALARLGASVAWVALDGPEADAWAQVRRATDRGEHVLVCGSHRLVAAVRARARATEGESVAHSDPSDPR